ncbi:heterokaryon incompatibility protein-domain-containing protein [Cladorrhinum sp. PSN259]|nr:heterokaryon incompatibility protein-domain-containing protein [Cladorrhinum sp. PSN259]
MLDHQPYFHYEPLDDDASSRRCFRLCKILPGSGDSPVLCELTNEAISAQSGRYEALSYTWGTDKQQRWIKLNGKPYWVRPNLLLALRTIRKPDEALVVWVDAICINQSDGAERVRQVSVMGDIYRNAKQVLAWIGPAADNSDAFFDYLENLDRRKGVDEDDDDDDPEKESKMAVVKTALRHLNNRPYWRRAWIKQELILSRNITVYCGSRKSQDMETFFRFGSIHQLSQVEGYEDHMLKLYLHRSERREGKSETLKELMDRYSNTECARVRDRVFALYSLAADCQDPESTTSVIDYDISIPALFFALLAHFRPPDILGFSATLQNVLNVREVRLQEYWDKASIREIRGNKPTGVSAAEASAMDYIRQIKAYRSALSCGGDDKPIPAAPDFIVRSHMAKSAPEALGKRDVHVRIDGSKFSLRMKHTLLGLRLLNIYEGDKEFTRSLTEQEASKFMHLVLIVLSDKGKHFYGQEAFERVSGITETQWAEAERPSIEIICSGLAEMSRREDKYTMCLVDCRFLLSTFHGYSLLRPDYE